MKPNKVDPFCDELIRLASVLNYDGLHVKDKARISMTAELRQAWVLKTPHPESYIDYLNLRRRTGHQLEDVVSFNQNVAKEKNTFNQDKSDERKSKPRDLKKKDKGQGRRNSKVSDTSPSNSSKPFQSEYALKYKEIPQTLADKRKRPSQCSRCGSADHFWRKCSAPQPVVMSSRQGKKRTAEATDLKAKTIPKTRHIKAAPTVKKLHNAKVHGSPPLLEVDTDASD